MNQDDVIRARDFATKAHAGQLRKDGKTPYIEHPREVVRILARYERSWANSVDDESQVLAWLHDTVEDTAVTTKDIQREFGCGMAALVTYISTPEYRKHSMKRAHRKLYDHMRLQSAPFIVKLVKIADRIANLRDVDHLKPDFRELYAMESWNLRNALLAGVEYDGLSRLVAELDAEIAERIPKLVMEDE